MRVRATSFMLMLAASSFGGDDHLPLGERAQRYLVDLVRLDTTNPPGNETRVAEYLKQVTANAGLAGEMLGPDPRRLNFLVRLKGQGKGRPLLLMSHSDVAQADRTRWTADPFGGEIKQGYLYGRGASDSKALLAAQLAVLVEIRRRNIPLSRDIVLLAEADEIGTSSGMTWLLQNAAGKLDAELALNSGGFVQEAPGGHMMYFVQTAEKIPLRVSITARPAAGLEHPIIRLSRALVKIAEAEQPVKLSPGTRRFFQEMARQEGYEWLTPLLARLESGATAVAAAEQLKKKNPEWERMLRTVVSPQSLRAAPRGSFAEAQLDVRRLPHDSREELLARLRQAAADPTVEITAAAGTQMPAAEASPLTSPLYRAMERVFNRIHPEDVVIPYLSTESSDSTFLRARGMQVFGAPLFLGQASDSRLANDERISLKSFQDGTEMLWQIVLEVAGASPSPGANPRPQVPLRVSGFPSPPR
jgi:acetylornithine deacetylase/succinyl-diaminopimelate desuccinylase-like protein